MLQDAVLRPIGSFINTMEATKVVTISLVLPMIGLLLKALDCSRPILCFNYEDLSPTPEKLYVKVWNHVLFMFYNQSISIVLCCTG